MQGSPACVDSPWIEKKISVMRMDLCTPEACLEISRGLARSATPGSAVAYSSHPDWGARTFVTRRPGVSRVALHTWLISLHRSAVRVSHTTAKPHTRDQ